MIRLLKCPQPEFPVLISLNFLLSLNPGRPGFGWLPHHRLIRLLERPHPEFPVLISLNFLLSLNLGRLGFGRLLFFIIEDQRGRGG